MPNLAFGRPNHTFVRNERMSNRKILRTVNTAGLIGGGGYSTYYTIPSGYVGVVDSIRCTATMPAAASGVWYLFMRIGGADVSRFAFQTDANANMMEHHWRTSGMIVPEGSAIEFATDIPLYAATLYPITVEMDLTIVPVGEAMTLGLLAGGTFIKGSPAGLGAGTRTVLVPGVAGKCIEILGLCATGGLQGAAGPDNVLLEFSDAGSNHYKVFQFGHANAALMYNGIRNTYLGEHPLHIRGPKGFNLSVTATTNLVSTKPVIVYGRYVAEHETFECTGAPQGGGNYQTDVQGNRRGGTYFWFFNPNVGVANTFMFPGTGAGSTSPDQLAIFRGYHLQGYTAGLPAWAICGQADTAPLGNRFMGTNYVNATFLSYRDDMDAPCLTSAVNPMFNISSALTLAGQTVWGYLRPSSTVSAGYTGAMFGGV